jgi:hypothetical protein
VSTSSTDADAASSARTRVAIALAPATETEVVALVAALDALGMLDRYELIVPALDAGRTTDRIRALLPASAAVRVEAVHDYLDRGHDLAVLADDDPSMRGRSMAALLADTAARPRGDDTHRIAPAAVIAWLARSWSLNVPEQLWPAFPVECRRATPVSDDDVLLRVRAGDGSYDPASVRFAERHVTRGDVVVDVIPGTGAVTVCLARITGPTGHVIAIGSDEGSPLRDNLALNEVLAWTDVATPGEPSTVARVVDELPRVDLLRIGRADHELDYLAAAVPAMCERRVGRLLARVGPTALRPRPDPLRSLLRDLQHKIGASFAAVAWDGSASPSSLDELLSEDDFVLLAADMTGGQ